MPLTKLVGCFPPKGISHRMKDACHLIMKGRRTGYISVQGLFQALCSGITPSGTWGAICGARDQTDTLNNKKRIRCLTICNWICR